MNIYLNSARKSFLDKNEEDFLYAPPHQNRKQMVRRIGAPRYRKLGKSGVHRRVLCGDCQCAIFHHRARPTHLSATEKLRSCTVENFFKNQKNEYCRHMRNQIAHFHRVDESQSFTSSTECPVTLTFFTLRFACGLAFLKTYIFSRRFLLVLSHEPHKNSIKNDYKNIETK